jgi:hypothetical protein
VTGLGRRTYSTGQSVGAVARTPEHAIDDVMTAAVLDLGYRDGAAELHFLERVFG